MAVPSVNVIFGAGVFNPIRRHDTPERDTIGRAEVTLWLSRWECDRRLQPSDRLLAHPASSSKARQRAPGLSTKSLGGNDGAAPKREPIGGAANHREMMSRRWNLPRLWQLRTMRTEVVGVRDKFIDDAVGIAVSGRDRAVCVCVTSGYDLTTRSANRRCALLIFVGSENGTVMSMSRSSTSTR